MSPKTIFCALFINRSNQGVGARELVFVYAHTYAGIDETAAVAFSLIFFLITAGVSLMGAFGRIDFKK